VFETLFKYPGVVARHRTGPSAEARERFLKPCVGQGLAGATLLRPRSRTFGNRLSGVNYFFGSATTISPYQRQLPL